MHRLLLTTVLLASAHADIIVVNTDSTNAGSLRQAIADATAGDTITFDSSLSGATIVLSGTQLVIDKSLTIDASALTNGITIDANRASRVLRLDGGEVTLRNFTIIGGMTPNTGDFVQSQCGAAILVASSNLTAEGMTFAQNSTNGAGNGGAVYNLGQTVTLTNCTFIGNEAGRGGAILNNFGSLSLKHCTVIGNTSTAASDLGGGGILNSQTTASLEDTIVAQNISHSSDSSADLGAANGSSFVTTGVNLIGDLAGSGLTATGTILTGDPLLARFGDYGGDTETMPPLPGSPAIDAATGSSFTTDQRGAPRDDGSPDLGAVEYRPAIVTTASDEADAPEGADLSLREAIAREFASTVTFAPGLDGSTIHLKTGTTTLGALTIDKALTIDASSLAGGIKIDGGSNGFFVEPAGHTRCFLITEGDDAQFFPVTFTNLTVQNGVSDGLPGANIHNRENLTLNHCDIINGRGSGDYADGGGIYNVNGTLRMADCRVAGNYIIGDYADGGGICSLSGSVTMENCSVTGNSATTPALPLIDGNRGGGIFSLYGSLTMDRCSVTGNDAEYGGGIYSDTNLNGQKSLLIRCTIVGNFSREIGGGYHNHDGLSELIHCTVTGNVALSNLGNGITSYADEFTRTELTATIVRDNFGRDVEFVINTDNPFNSFLSKGRNLVGTGNAIGRFSAGDGEVNNAPILLAPLGTTAAPRRPGLLCRGAPPLMRRPGPLPSQTSVACFTTASRISEQRTSKRTRT